MPKTINIDRDGVYQLADAAGVCGLSSTTLQAAIKAGELPATKRSRRTYIEGDALWRWITGRPQPAEAARG